MNARYRCFSGWLVAMIGVGMAVAQAQFNEWEVMLTATGLPCGQFVFGAKDGATLGYDEGLDKPLPPSLPGGWTGGFKVNGAPAGSLLGQDYHPTGLGSGVWEFQLNAPAGQNVGLSWSTAAAAAAPNALAILTENGGTIVANMAVTGTHTFAVGGKGLTRVFIAMGQAAPIALDDAVQMLKNGVVDIDVLANDFFPAGSTPDIVDLTAGPDTNGSVFVETDLDGYPFVRYTPTAGFSGTATFTYKASGGLTTSAEAATVTVRVSQYVALQAPAPVSAATPGEAYTFTVGATVDPAVTDLSISLVLPVTAEEPPQIWAIVPGSLSISGGGAGVPELVDHGDGSAVVNFNGVIPTSFSFEMLPPDRQGAATPLIFTQASGTAGTAFAEANLLTVDIPVARFTANNATLTVAEDSGFTPVDLSGKFTDQLGNPVAATVTGITPPANGIAQLVGGIVSYRPNPDYFGLDNFTYTATDGDNASAAGTIHVTVTPVNDAPVIGSLVIYQGTPSIGTPVAETALQEDGQYYLVVSASDIDNPPTELNATITYRGQTLAPVTRQETGPNSTTLTAVLPMDYDAVDHPNRTANYAIEVVIDDGEDQNEATASLPTTIHDVDRRPIGGLAVALPPTAFTGQDITAVPTVGAVDPDGDAQNVVYDWNLLTRGGGSFTDASMLPSGATTKGDVWRVTARLQTNPYGDGTIVHDAPEASAEVTILNSDPTLGLLAHKMFIQKPTPVVPPVVKSFNLAAAQPSDADGDPLHYVVTTLPTRGTLSYESASSRGTAIDSVPTVLPAGVSVVLYTVTDPETEYFDANAGPQADEIQYTVTDGDAGLGGEPEEFRGVSQQTAVVKVDYRENQRPEIVGTPTPAVPLPMDEVIGAAGTPNSQTFSIVFTDDDDPSGNGEMERLDWYVSADNGTTWSLQAVPGRAPLSGSFVFQTDYDTIFNGIDGTPDQRPASKVFLVKAVGVDTQGGETEHIWNVTVNDVDRLPTAPTVAITPNPAYTDDDLLATVTVASTDPDGDPIVGYDFEWQQTPLLNTDTLPADHTAKHETWQVSARALTHPYGVTNIPGLAGTDAVTISNSPPVATDDATTTDEDNHVDIPLVMGATTRLLGVNPDTDADGDNLVVKSLTQPSKGVATLVDGGKAIDFDPNGQFEYLAPGDSEEVSFTYTVTDGDPVDEGTDTATVTVTVTGVNDQAVPQNLSVATDIDETVEFEVTVVDPDDGQTHEFILHDTATPAAGAPTLLAPANGTVGLADPRRGVAAASLVYTPNAGFVGFDSFQFAAWDGYEYGTVGTVTVAVGRPPQAAADSYATTRDAPLAVPAPGVLYNDTDPQGMPMAATLVESPAHGTVELDADGGFTYQPEAGFVGYDRFTYRAGNGGFESNPATVDLVVDDTVELTFVAGWNLVTLPLWPFDNPGGGRDGAPLGAWRWNGNAYVAAEHLEPGLGYWIFADQEHPLTVAGQPANLGQIVLQPGWNMVGVDQPLPVADLPPQVRQCFQWNTALRQYQKTVDLLLPKIGYWLYYAE